MKYTTLLIAAFVSLTHPVYAQQQDAVPGAISAQVDPNPGHVTIIQQPSAPAAAPAAVIDTGTYAGQTLMYVVSVAGTAIASLVVKLLLQLMQQMGLKTTQAIKDALQNKIVNAINLGAAKAAEELQGHGKIEIKNAAVATAIAYVQAHGAEDLKKLGVDPTSDEAKEAIKARIETAIADPAAPTAAVLDPVGEAPKVAPVQVADAKLETAAGVAKA